MSLQVKNQYEFLSRIKIIKLITSQKYPINHNEFEIFKTVEILCLIIKIKIKNFWKV